MKILLMPPRSSSLIFDRVPAADRAEAFSRVDARVIDTRFTEEIFIIPALLAALQMLRIGQGMDFSIHYLVYVVRLSGGRRVIGFSPLNRHLQQMALQLEGVEFHLFQTGILSSTSPRSSESIDDDYPFAPNVTNYVFGKSHVMERFSKQKIVHWGSLLNNLWLSGLSDEKLVDRVIFISQWRPFLSSPDSADDQALSKSLVEAFRQTLLWGSSRGIEVAVLSNSKTSANGSAEADFYAEVSHMEFSFIKTDSSKESYERCQESRYISTFNSTLGIEMLGRGKLVAFWGLDEAYKPLLGVETLSRYFREMGLDLTSSCDLGVQLDFFLSNEAFVLSEEIRNDIMVVQPPSIQASALSKLLA